MHRKRACGETFSAMATNADPTKLAPNLIKRSRTKCSFIETNGSSREMAMLPPPRYPCFHHFRDASAIRLGNRVLAGECFECPEPRVRSTLQLLKDQRQHRRSQTDDTEIRRMHGSIGHHAGGLLIRLPLLH